MQHSSAHVEEPLSNAMLPHQLLLAGTRLATEVPNDRKINVARAAFRVPLGRQMSAFCAGVRSISRPTGTLNRQEAALM